MSMQDEEIIAEIEEVAATHADAPETTHDDDDADDIEDEDDSEED